MKELIKERINQHMLEKSSDSRNHQLENRDGKNQRKNDDIQYHDRSRNERNNTGRDSSRYDRYKNEKRDFRQSKNEQGKYYSRNKSSSDYYNRQEKFKL